MSEEVKFIPYEVALEIVGNVIEEEHIHEDNRRILTVYDKQGNEICWYDAEEVLAEAQPENPRDPNSVKQAAVEVIMRQIPVWALEDVLRRVEEQRQKKCNCSD